MELDILMYTDPNVFLDVLKTKPYVFAYHNPGHCNTGIFYVKDSESLQPVLTTLDTYKTNFRSEMTAFYDHYIKHPDTTLFPLFFESNENSLFWKDYTQFHTYLFDGASMGIYLFGTDPFHTNGIIKTKDIQHIEKYYLQTWNHGTIVWIKNLNGLFIPYFRKNTTDALLPIANLHIHSKDLLSAVSYTSKDI